MNSPQTTGLTWRKSSHSGGSGNGDCVEVAWRKSSHSGGSGNGNCVEVAYSPVALAVRDSKNATGSVLDFPPGSWHVFLAAATGR